MVDETLSQLWREFSLKLPDAALPRAVAAAMYETWSQEKVYARAVELKLIKKGNHSTLADDSEDSHLSAKNPTHGSAEKHLNKRISNAVDRKHQYFGSPEFVFRCACELVRQLPSRSDLNPKCVNIILGMLRTMGYQLDPHSPTRTVVPLESAWDGDEAIAAADSHNQWLPPMIRLNKLFAISLAPKNAYDKRGARYALQWFYMPANKRRDEMMEQSSPGVKKLIAELSALSQALAEIKCTKNRKLSIRVSSSTESVKQDITEIDKYEAILEQIVHVVNDIECALLDQPNRRMRQQEENGTGEKKQHPHFVRWVVSEHELTHVVLTRLLDLGPDPNKPRKWKQTMMTVTHSHGGTSGAGQHGKTVREFIEKVQDPQKMGREVATSCIDILNMPVLDLAKLVWDGGSTLLGSLPAKPAIMAILCNVYRALNYEYDVSPLVAITGATSGNPHWPNSHMFNTGRQELDKWAAIKKCAPHTIQFPPLLVSEGVFMTNPMCMCLCLCGLFLHVCECIYL
jgi:hypothetical protein